MPVDFTALDFETANGFRGSACSVGLVKVRDGRIVAKDSWLMRPPAGYDHFDARNVQIHGIHPGDVAGSPRFAETYERLREFVAEDMLLAHNAAFDIGVIRAGLQASRAAAAAIDYACTLKIARRTYELASYSLPFAAHAAGFDLTDHHEALADAEACAAIAIDAARRHEAGSIPELLSALGVAASRLEAFEAGAQDAPELRDARGWRASEHRLPSRAGAPWPAEGPNPEPDASADPANPLFGETIVFTGDLGLPRPEAKVRAAAVGGRTADRVTRATTVLVVGDGFVAEDLERGRLTRKARHVLARREMGQHVEVVSEAEFLQMVGGAWPQGL